MPPRTASRSKTSCAASTPISSGAPRPQHASNYRQLDQGLVVWIREQYGQAQALPAALATVEDPEIRRPITQDRDGRVRSRRP